MTSLAYRKYLIKKKEAFQRTGVRYGKCGCGGMLKTRDHGTWVGYYCPKCQCGGSYNK